MQWKTSPYPPRKWQAEAVKAVRHHLERSIDADPVIISAVMGAGKSSVIGELARTYKPDAGVNQVVAITTPTVSLVDQLARTVEIFAGQCGKYYTHEKSIKPITVVCIASIPQFVESLTKYGMTCRVWIADEAHKTECDTVLSTYESLNPKRSIGMTATPFRADKKESLSLWKSLAYEYTAAQAIQDGVVLPPKIRQYTGQECTLDQASISMIEQAIADRYGPGIVNAKSIEDADQFCDRLNMAKIPAATVHSRRTKAENDDNIERLQSGKLKALVHVNMLAEGADFPWLEWLCLRRPTRSRVRFCQEVGRVLRTHKGKEHGLILDPLDLFDTFGLTDDYEAVLGWDNSEDKPAEDEAADELMEILEEMKGDDSMPRETKMAKALDPCISWVRKAKMALKSAGYLEEKITSTHWRKDFASDKQMELVCNKVDHLVRILPDRHRVPAIAAGKLAAEGLMNKGVVSDYISIAMTVTKKGWPEMAEGLVE